MDNPIPITAEVGPVVTPNTPPMGERGQQIAETMDGLKEVIRQGAWMSLKL